MCEITKRHSRPTETFTLLKTTCYQATWDCQAHVFTDQCAQARAKLFQVSLMVLSEAGYQVIVLYFLVMCLLLNIAYAKGRTCSRIRTVHTCCI